MFSFISLFFSLKYSPLDSTIVYADYGLALISSISVLIRLPIFFGLSLPYFFNFTIFPTLFSELAYFSGV